MGIAVIGDVQGLPRSVELRPLNDVAGGKGTVLETISLPPGSYILHYAAQVQLAPQYGGDGVEISFELVLGRPANGTVLDARTLRIPRLINGSGVALANHANASSLVPYSSSQPGEVTLSAWPLDLSFISGTTNEVIANVSNFQLVAMQVGAIFTGHIPPKPPINIILQPQD